MTKTLDELRKAWVDASADYDRAVEAHWDSLKGRDYLVVVASIADMDNAQRAMHIAWANYDAAFKAHLDAMDDAAKIKPCESATTPALPPPLPR